LTFALLRHGGLYTFSEICGGFVVFRDIFSGLQNFPLFENIF
jgi:hypothetical protein